MNDSERIDILEKIINTQGAILLHDGVAGAASGFIGLGLRPGCMNRTLREAIDDCDCLCFEEDESEDERSNVAITATA